MSHARLLLVSLILVWPVAVASPLGDPVGEPVRYVVAFDGAIPEDVRVGGTYGGGSVVRLDEPLAFAVVETRVAALLENVARADPRVRYVEFDDPTYARPLLAPNDARYNDAGHWGSKRIGAEAAWDRTTGSTAVKVAVIDSGLRKTHEEFAGSGRMLQGWDFVQGDDDPNDTCGHGTHVTGTIAATINNGVGIAGLAQATVLPVKGLSNSLVILCSGSTSQLASALRYAGDQGAHLSSNSWGGGGSSAVTDAINYAHAKGVTHVAAAGNDGSCTNCVSEPWRANAAKVVIVSSTTSGDGFSSFSSEGPQVDVAAPGSSILSSYNSNDASYSTLSGTSMATPHVTGTLALLKTLNPGWGYAELDARIKETAVDLGASGFDNRFGHGRIDADAATQPATPPPPAACADGTDNDGDGLTDYPEDPGCTSTDDDDETDPVPGNDPPLASFAHVASGLTVSVDGSGSSDPDGSVVAWSWDWGDGTPEGSGVTASHTYAAGGTYTLTLTVTDDDGATDSASAGVTVEDPTDPDPAVPTLANGETRSDTIQGVGSEKFYKVQLPAGASQLQVVMDGPACGLLSCNPDLDLYVRQGAKPTNSQYDCRPYEGDSDETCTLSGPASGWWYIRVHVYGGSNSGSYTVRASW